MKETLSRSFELFQRHPILWVPGSAALLIVFVLKQLERAWIHWMFNQFSTQHSVLGGEVFSAEGAAEAQSRSIMMATPVGLCRAFLTVLFFTLAFVVTANLARMIEEGTPASLGSACKAAIPQWRRIAWFAIVYMVVAGSLALVSLLFSTPLFNEQYHQIFASRLFIRSFATLCAGCLAWVLLPKAIRLLQSSPVSISPRRRVLAAVVVALVDFVGLLVEDFLHWAEQGRIRGNHWDAIVVSAGNSLLTNLAQVFLFVFVAVLATQSIVGIERND
jgi:hypothetical protein